MSYKKTLFILSSLFFINLSGCDQSDEQASPVMQLQPDRPLPLWLDGQVDLTPQAWLVQRSRANYAAYDSEVLRAAELLVKMSDRYDESHRMIANRAAQLEDMLHEEDINEYAIDLMAWFADLPRFNSPHSFSALCQYYVTLRKQGRSADEILEYWLETE